MLRLSSSRCAKQRWPTTRERNSPLHYGSLAFSRGREHENRVPWRRSCGAVLRHSGEEGQPRLGHHRFRTQPSRGYLRLGIVFSDKTMDGFRAIDEETHAEITNSFRHWDDIDVFFKGRKITSSG